MAAGFFVVAFDLARPPPEQASARGLLLGIDFYQEYLRSPVKSGMGVRCRFEPTCSRYAEASIRRYGAGRGLARSVWRIMRCAPWTPRGTVDPP